MNGTTRLHGFFAFVTAGSMMVFTGCDAGTGPGEPELASEDAAAIAGLISDVDLLSVGLAALSATSGTRTLTRSAPCPAGGSVSVNGSSESARDDKTLIVSTKWSATQTHAACAFTRTRGEQTLTAVIDGSVTTGGNSSYQLPKTRGEPRTLLSWSSTKVGSTTTKVGDRTNTCAVDVKETYDPATKVFTLTGVVCGRQVNTTRTLGR